ncbi:MAG: glycerophosphodiester phosphodiesterase [Firmicutes bacterium]|nr:glycerophosphodiester phosphodiesterase [Bacillota bacterium]
MTPRPLILAHRGASLEAPENTLAAFRQAIELGADGIELDVHLSGDGELVVIHDERVDRTTNGKGWVKDLTLSQLKSLDAGSWFDPAFKGERIPTLREVIDLVSGRCKLINIEIKSGIVLYPGIEEKVLREVEAADLLGKVIMSSFNHFSLKTIKEMNPDVKTGILYIEGLVDPWIYARHVPADALHPIFHAVTPEIVNGAHSAGLGVHVWTVDKPEDITRMSGYGVDAVITNDPGTAVHLGMDR